MCERYRKRAQGEGGSVGVAVFPFFAYLYVWKKGFRSRLTNSDLIIHGGILKAIFDPSFVLPFDHKMIGWGKKSSFIFA